MGIYIEKIGHRIPIELDKLESIAREVGLAEWIDMGIQDYSILGVCDGYKVHLKSKDWPHEEQRLLVKSNGDTYWIRNHTVELNMGVPKVYCPECKHTAYVVESDIGPGD